MIVTASALNVRSGPGTAFRKLSQLSKGAAVEVLERSGEWAWVHPSAGWVHSGYLAPLPPRSIAAPHGLSAIKKMFGEPGAPQASAGRVALPAPLLLGWQLRTQVVRVACNSEMEAIFTAVFQEIYTAGLWSLLKTFDGIYNNRYKTGGRGAKSTHAWGIAVDLNAATNGYGTTGDMPLEIIRIFEAHGFTHLKKDPMHFQYATGY